VKKLRICIIAHNAFGALSGGRQGHVGGAERQTALLAHWLAERGHEVSFITWDEGQPDGAMLGRVKNLKVSSADAGVPVIRFFHPRMTGLFAAMRRADAEIYYHNSAEYVTGLAAWWCRKNARRFAYSVASDVACQQELPAMSKPHERFLYRYGVRHTDLLIVQTERQRRMLKEGFGAEAVMLPMPCPGPPNTEVTTAKEFGAPRIVWVGRVADMKRLEWLLDIAERLPTLPFDVVAANMDNSSYAQGLYARAQQMPNVHWLGALPRERMPEVYQKAFCLCCTSSYEGFPNTFLEAWSYGRPVVTSFDPDKLVATRKLGIVAADVEGLVKGIQLLVQSRDEWQKMSHNALAYFESNHTAEVAMPRFEVQFLKTLGYAESERPAHLETVASHP
jgi:glycosyltransferase involved in cell wall biosynthesis